MLKVTINEQQTVDIESTKGQTLLNGQPFQWDLVALDNGRFHILQNGRSYNAEVIEADYAEKSFKLKINQSTYTVTAKDRFDVLLEKMGMTGAAKNKVNHLKAPMPGLIWDIKVQVGDTVKAGDIVLVLVAMKMENALKSPGEGVVKSIKINKGDTVDKNRTLIEFE
ncbi:biotin/lipoyl-containing protein [Runella slithyformis]|uniref:Biotin/lipoyl attachment domain-containing protein n=1 Tax=Runella slithyformis (strain ATCC 29530 / DSM 19594 / LMG 11500 / NCIMB 11436 / LSU 4) TaxID=761193 RepID=A0A7U3ZHV3_RUNSL|nr:acetyl-CoA carboxylase biotin carboxyl carrier protein subunit [Runella slithyformis]AEI47498.1 biotin/lipoyl attachment domain-containing protein [Runella slithyformis DSM 19594]